MSEPLDSYVQVATDGSGKRMRNAVRYVQQADGTVYPVYEEYVQLVGPDGKPLRLEQEFANLTETVRQLTDLLSQSEHPFSRVQQALTARALPAKAEAYQPISVMSDSFGRQVTLPGATRDMVISQTTTISASTSETTILTGQPTYFLDPFLILVANTSAATSTRIDFRDATGGTIRFPLQSVGGAAPVGFALPIPIPQTKAGDNWTAQCAASTTDVRITVYAVRNQ